MLSNVVCRDFGKVCRHTVSCVNDVGGMGRGCKKRDLWASVHWEADRNSPAGWQDDPQVEAINPLKALF